MLKALARLTEIAGKFQKGDKVQFRGPADDVKDMLKGTVTSDGEITDSDSGKKGYSVKAGKTTFFVYTKYVKAAK